MFRIRYRITEKPEYIKSLGKQGFDQGDLEGFFEMNFNENKYGYFHDRPLDEGEQGSELLTNWFSSVLEAFIVLQKSDYVAISDIDSFNTWIELKKTSNIIVTSIVKAEKGNGTSNLSEVPMESYNYGEWKNILIYADEFGSEIIGKTRQYLQELESFSEEISCSHRFLELHGLLSEAIKVFSTQ